jgi:hypothetical protein
LKKYKKEDINNIIKGELKLSESVIYKNYIYFDDHYDEYDEDEDYDWYNDDFLALDWYYKEYLPLMKREIDICKLLDEGVPSHFKII